MSGAHARRRREAITEPPGVVNSMSAEQVREPRHLDLCRRYTRRFRPRIEKDRGATFKVGGAPRHLGVCQRWPGRLPAGVKEGVHRKLIALQRQH
jgi:hypothetical protein